ncbi:probable ATP-dependent RNA helicase vasa-like isoform X2 [Panulirus ornatus]|uniref:probable ATP-dependent RNA helicase vasa-like isoform X2 n=1 Tax=Panulirus ornatus TaxID=150431 RepID=UPI003A878E00
MSRSLCLVTQVSLARLSIMSDWEDDDNFVAAAAKLSLPVDFCPRNDNDTSAEMWQPVTVDQFSSVSSNTRRGGGVGGGGRRGRGQRRRGGNCFKCNKDGHLSRDCHMGGDFRGEQLYVQGRKGFKVDDGCKPQNHPKFGPRKVGAIEESRPPLYIPQDLQDEALFDMGIQVGENFEAYGDIPVEVTGDDPKPQPEESFDDMNLRELLRTNMMHAGYRQPTPIQKYAIPILQSGRDLMACAQTGSGKTAAFLLPMLQYIIEGNIENHALEEFAQPVGLVLSPTRELALQIYYEARKFACGSSAKCSIVYGGAAINYQVERLKKAGCHILVATPGRLKDLLRRGRISMSSLKFLIFDEADRMLDMGFIDDMQELVAHETMPPKSQRQTMMFSATFPDMVQQCAIQFLKNYLFLVVGSIGAANKDVIQEVLEVRKANKREILLDYLMKIQSCDKVLVFVERKQQADFIGAYLCTENINAVTIHGDRFQSQREEALAAFRTGRNSVLVATSVAARGLDIRGVSLVINYDLPKSVDEYVHRIGRTGRLGNQGHAISFFDQDFDASIAKDLVKILNDAGQVVPDWLMIFAHKSGHQQTYYGSGRFTSADIRSKDGYKRPEEFTPIECFGGPSLVATAEEEEFWD